MTSVSHWSGDLLATAMAEQPSLILSFYTFGVMLRKQEGAAVSEYPVDAAHVAAALSAKVRFDTGLMSENTLLVRHEGVKRTVVEYRSPGKTGIFLEGAETALRVPLPPLILIRVTTDNAPQYGLYAVKKRPSGMDEPLFHAPLPNVFTSGAICWGSVKRVSDEALAGTSLNDDWTMLLGSPFGDHACSGKSKAHPSDIRKQLIELEGRKARVYPKRDLIPVKKTLAQVLGDER
ncbi:MAG: hypothetical protein SF029_09150 [bacterium]|nr:hypothetical protein [bacterium]